MEVERLLAGGHDRVGVVLLDAFGRRFLERHADHPFLRRLEVTELSTQFPSTTTAHVTTMHTGRPVGEHGLYEWHVYEPSLYRLVTPLLFSFAGDGMRGTLLGQIDPDELFPTDSLYARLADAGIRSTVILPASIAGSAPNIALLRGTEVLPFTTARDSLAVAAEALAGGAAYAHVYLDEVDSLMHAVGTDDPAVDAVTRGILDDVHGATFPGGTLVLLTADHGMSPVDPERTIYVNELWPELAEHLETGADGKPLAPAGSCRDLFLHARDGEVEAVCAGLAERLDGVSDVVRVAELVEEGIFAQPSPRLSARLANVAVLPRYGEGIYWHEPDRFVQRLHAQHGGLTPQEMEIPLVAWVA